MPEPKSKDGFSGRVLVISMLTGAAILGVAAVLYRRTHPPIIVPIEPTSTQATQ